MDASAAHALALTGREPRSEADGIAADELLQEATLSTEPPDRPVFAQESADGGAQTTWPIYLRTDFEPVFAMVHVPPEARRLGTGVVVCPVFGWDDLCTYRARRVWATRLCHAGHPVIRFDLPGTGDSPGTPHAPDRLAAWTDAVAAAAGWLRGDAACGRVAALGIGLGGMLAWNAAAQGAPIDDLALWAVPAQGRRLLREARAAASLSIDPVIEDDEVARASVSDDGLLDEAGQLTTTETLEALSNLDLRKLSLPDPSRRRVLVFERSGHEGDRGLSELCSAAGVDLTVAAGDDYEPMMRYVQQSQTPVESIERSIAWLADGPSGDTPTAGLAAVLARTTQTVSALETDVGGVAIRERNVTLEVAGQTLRGIVTEPVGVPSAGVCAVFLSGGSDRRIGPNRLWVDISRRWAAQGVQAVRVDPSGIGDSEGDDRFWDPLPAHYMPQHVDRVIDLLDALEAQGLPPRFVLTGFCSGGYRSLHVAARDRRVAGVFAIGLPFFHWTPWVRVRDWWVQDWDASSLDAWWKRTAVRGLQRVLPVLTRARKFTLGLPAVRARRSEVMLRSLSERGTELLLLFKSGSHEWDELGTDGRLDRISALPGVQLRVIPGKDIRFRPLALQAHVNGLLDAALERVLARGVQWSARPDGPKSAQAAMRARLNLQNLARPSEPTAIDMQARLTD